MTKGKARKRKKHKRNSEKPPPPETGTSILQTVAAWLGIIGFFVGLGMSVLSLLPKIAVSAASSLDPNNAFATPFIIKNDGPLSIKTVEYSCGLYRLEFVKPPIIQRYAQEDVRFVFTDASAKIAANESATVFCPFSFDKTFAQLGPLISGDLSVIISYRPAFVFWRREQRQRFSTIKAADGKLYWHPRSD